MTMQGTMQSETQARTQLLMRLFLSIGVLPILLAIALVLFSLLSENFFTFNNIANVLRQTSYLTIVALGQVGSHPGYLMRRGTVILADSRARPLPTFNDNGEHELLAIHLLLESLVEYGSAFRRLAKQRRFRRWVGDLGAGGQGEILLPAA